MDHGSGSHGTPSAKQNFSAIYLQEICPFFSGCLGSFHYSSNIPPLFFVSHDVLFAARTSKRRCKCARGDTCAAASPTTVE
ncbi:hypothetical protein C8R44DRAFT_778253 [Mycena epipterygia]|nr:hypothetical protein C8R44DRAFT_778253 [Mycena epipterygia]